MRGPAASRWPGLCHHDDEQIVAGVDGPRMSTLWLRVSVPRRTGLAVSKDRRGSLTTVRIHHRPDAVTSAFP